MMGDEKILFAWSCIVYITFLLWIKKTGACQLEKGTSNKWNAGNANGNLAFDDGVLVLNYTGGTPCHQNKYQRNTVINFICKKGAGEGTPAFIDESESCTYFVYWHTELACEEKVS